ncbi:iron-containing alcohol dehydrogenase [Allosalinactinospora lopnorensis]|uniref:iron-containing alcohol dehydrogenase n=1 Tax=Allosalinactinospora lopnorensis TaxID=1352348 RepID=UPI000A695139|nr:iron-containing alcohol dehydrogenase [Allosalinactinospora lopnorensis]
MRRATRMLDDGDADCVVGIGGGSSMDTAKAVALLGTGDTEMRAYKAPVTTDVPALPVVAVPTTAGSGSECTRFTIITDSETDEKMLCGGLAFLPQTALVDYELTVGMPPRLTADTGVDALVHAIEAYVSVKANPFTDTLALAAMRTISANLRTAYADSSARAAREAMTLGATQAGLAFSNSSVALVHGMSRPIGAHFGVAHGLSNAMLMPAVTGFSIPDAPVRYADCARAMGIADSSETHDSATARLVDELHRLNRDLAVPSPREYGIDEQRWHELVPLMAAQARDSGSPANNPRVPATAEIEDLHWSLGG